MEFLLAGLFYLLFKEKLKNRRYKEAEYE